MNISIKTMAYTATVLFSFVFIISSFNYCAETTWTHESIMRQLDTLEDFDENYNSVNEHENECSYKAFEYDPETLTEDALLQIKDLHLYLNGNNIMDLTEPYNAALEYVTDPENPLLISGRAYQLSDTKTLYVVNLLGNRYTGGRDPGENYFFVEDTYQDQDTAGSIIQLPLNKLYKVSRILKDSSNNAWIDGYIYYWRSNYTDLTLTLTEDNQLINWTDVIVNSNHMESNITAYTQYIQGENGQYIWFWTNEANTEYWEMYPMKTGRVYKVDVLDTQPELERVATCNENSKAYGMKEQSDYNHIPSKRILITADDQVYYKTNLPGYYHLNANEYIPYKDFDASGGQTIGTITGSYSKENLALVDYYGTQIRLYNFDGDYAIVAEDLRLWNAHMYYDDTARITILKLYTTNSTLPPASIKNSGNTLASDVKLYIDGHYIQSYNVGGYSLVKLNDLIDYDLLDENDLKIVAPQTGVQRIFGDSISGHIQTEFDHPASGQVILYGTNDSSKYKGSLRGVHFEGQEIQNVTELISTPFQINENEGSFEFSFNNSTLSRLPKYDDYFIGYKLDDDSNTGFYLADSSKNKGLLVYLSKLLPIHDDLTISLKKKAFVSQVFKIDHPLYYYDPLMKRSINIHVTKKSNGRLQDEMDFTYYFSQSKSEIPTKLELDANSEYEIIYEFTLYDDANGHSSVYDIETLSWIDLNQLQTDDNNTIHLPDIHIPFHEEERVGHGAKTDITVRVNNTTIPAINSDGYMLIPLEAIKRLGLTLTENEQTQQITAQENAPVDGNTLDITGFTLPDDYDSLSIGDYLQDTNIYLTGWLLTLNDSFIPIFRLQDRFVITAESLEHLGFDVVFNNDARTLTIENNR